MQIQVEFVNEFGEREAGIDAGGLFKEFWTELSSIAFDPSYGLFKVCCVNNIACVGLVAWLTCCCLHRRRPTTHCMLLEVVHVLWL